MRRKNFATTLLLVFGLAMSFSATAVAQDSGLDEYQEGVPTPGGEAPGVPSGTDDGTGTPEATSSGTDTGTATGTGTGVDAGTAALDTNGDGTVSETEAGAAGATPSGQLPATGFDETLLMAFIGLAMVSAGFALRRVLSPTA